MAMEAPTTHPQVHKTEPCREATLGWYAGTTGAALLPLVVTFGFGKVHDPGEFMRHGELLLIAIPVSIIGLLTLQSVRDEGPLNRILFWSLVLLLMGAMVDFALHTADSTALEASGKVTAADWGYIWVSIGLFGVSILLGGGCVVASRRKSAK